MDSVILLNILLWVAKVSPKEYMEIHFDKKTITLDDYKSMKGYSIKMNELKTATSQKGQKEKELVELYKALKTKGSGCPIELWDLVQITEISFLV